MGRGSSPRTAWRVPLTREHAAGPLTVTAGRLGSMKVSPPSRQLFGLTTLEPTATANTGDAGDRSKRIGTAGCALLIRRFGIVVRDPLPDVASHINRPTCRKHLRPLSRCCRGWPGPNKTSCACIIYAPLTTERLELAPGIGPSVTTSRCLFPLCLRRQSPPLESTRGLRFRPQKTSHRQRFVRTGCIAPSRQVSRTPQCTRLRTATGFCASPILRHRQLRHADTHRMIHERGMERLGTRDTVGIRCVTALRERSGADIDRPYRTAGICTHPIHTGPQGHLGLAVIVAATRQRPHLRHRVDAVTTSQP
jgi:hypothetical protein